MLLSLAVFKGAFVLNVRVRPAVMQVEYKIAPGALLNVFNW